MLGANDGESRGNKRLPARDREIVGSRHVCMCSKCVFSEVRSIVQVGEVAAARCEARFCAAFRRGCATTCRSSCLPRTRRPGPRRARILLKTEYYTVVDTAITRS